MSHPCPHVKFMTPITREKPPHGYRMANELGRHEGMTWGENRLALLVHAPNCLVWTVRESQVIPTTWHREKKWWNIVGNLLRMCMYTVLCIRYMLIYTCIDIFVLYMLSCLHIHARQREREREKYWWFIFKSQHVSYCAQPVVIFNLCHMLEMIRIPTFDVHGQVFFPSEAWIILKVWDAEAAERQSAGCRLVSMW